MTMNQIAKSLRQADDMFDIEIMVEHGTQGILAAVNEALRRGEEIKHPAVLARGYTIFLRCLCSALEDYIEEEQI